MSTRIEETAQPSEPPWYRRPFFVALVGSLLLLAAQPPLSWWLLAWIAPLLWLYLASQPALAGRRPFLKIWLAGFAYWVLAVHWIRLAHPATGLGRPVY